MTRQSATRARIDAFLERLGREFRGQGSLYLVGGSMMVYLGYRTQTEDIDYVLQITAGSDQDFIGALRRTQRAVDMNIEPASPGDFIPLPAGWHDRSPFLGRHGGLDIFGFDPISTALSKIERGLERDIADVLALVQDGTIAMQDLVAAFDEIVPRLEREALPRVQEADFRRKVAAVVQLGKRQAESQD